MNAKLKFSSSKLKFSSHGKEDSLFPMEHLSALRFNSRRLYRSFMLLPKPLYRRYICRAPSLIIYQRQAKKGKKKTDQCEKIEHLSRARDSKTKTNSPSGALLHCCVSLSRVGRRGRHIPGAEAGRRNPWKLDKLTTYASYSRTSPLRCSTFVSEGLLPSLFLVHLW